jgi:hypothetical protein
LSKLNFWENSNFEVLIKKRRKLKKMAKKSTFDKKSFLEAVQKVQKVLAESQPTEPNLENEIAELAEEGIVSAYSNIDLDDQSIAFQITVSEESLDELSNLYEDANDEETLIQRALKEKGEPFDVEVTEVERDEGFVTFIVKTDSMYFG